MLHFNKLSIIPLTLNEKAGLMQFYPEIDDIARNPTLFMDYKALIVVVLM